MKNTTDTKQTSGSEVEGASLGSAATVIPCGPKIPCRVITENGEELMMMQPTIILHDIIEELPPNK